jgi:N-methylhydantoinase A
MAEARDRFDEQHAQIHGHAAKERPVEIVSYRLRVRVTVPKYVQVPLRGVKQKPAPKGAVKGRRLVYFDAQRATEATLYERDKLPAGSRLAGPAIIEQFDATTVVPPGWSAAVDENMNLILTREAGRHG